MNFDNQVDASGLSCPLPILRAKKALATMSTGQILRVVATDPGSVRDFEAFARQTGNELIKSGEVGEGAFEFFLRRADR
jgi:tRNA 2-thiouridine synthesizing protein A